MVDPATAKQLADAGGWAAFLVVCGLLALAFHRGWIIPGWIYREKVALVDRLTVQLERNTDAVKRVALALERSVQRDRGPGSNAVP